LTLRWVNGWVSLETLIKAFNENELSVLDKYHENHSSNMFQKERQR
jgi:hypothetical protein